MHGRCKSYRQDRSYNSPFKSGKKWYFLVSHSDHSGRRYPLGSHSNHNGKDDTLQFPSKSSYKDDATSSSPDHPGKNGTPLPLRPSVTFSKHSCKEEASSHHFASPCGELKGSSQPGLQCEHRTNAPKGPGR